MVDVKKEDDDMLSDSNTNSSCPIDVSDSAKTVQKTKGKKEPAIVKVKTEIDEISDSCGSVTSSSKDIKREGAEEDKDEEMAEMQLKNEEVDIKPDDDEEG